MAKHSEATQAKCRELYLQRKAMKSGKAILEAPDKSWSKEALTAERAAQIAHIKRILAARLPDTEAKLRVAGAALDLSEAMARGIQAEDMPMYLQIRIKYIQVVDKLTELLIPTTATHCDSLGYQRQG